jgi:L-seryl-tRNA(Ser) seleniumtransferase
MLTHALKEAAQKLGMRDVPSLSSLQELLRQAGRWIDVATEPWSASEAKRLVAGINATGEWFSGRWTAPRLGSELLALHHLISTSSTEDADAERQCCTALMGATGAADALVAPHLGGAIDLAVRGLVAAGRIERVVLPRKYGMRIPSGPSHGGSMLPEMLEACGVSVREIGSNRECLESDWEQATQSPGQLLWVVSCGGADPSASYAHHRARSHESLSCDLVLDGSLHDLDEFGIAARALSRRWDDGPDLMIVPGHYLLGGPECGILLGKREWIQSIRSLAERSGLLAPRSTHLLLAETIRSSQTREGWCATPTGALLSNSFANLENRAKRIAAQCDLPQSSVRVECGSRTCKLGSGVWQDVALESAILRIIPKEGLATSRIAERLVQQSPAVWGNVYTDHIELVLRTVDPAADSFLVSALTGLASDNPSGDHLPNATSI